MENLYKLAMRAEKELESATKYFDRISCEPSGFEKSIELEIASEKMTKKLHYCEGVIDAIVTAGLIDEYYRYKRTH